jgi:hypothetical protein
MANPPATLALSASCPRLVVVAAAAVNITTWISTVLMAQFTNATYSVNL